MASSVSAIPAQLSELLTPVVADAGLDLEDVTVSRAGSRSVVRVVVDGDDGMDLDAVADVSRRVSAVLDDAGDLLRGAYVLEVTSPGVDRPLTAPRHWRRARNRLLRVLRTDGSEVVGRLRSASEDPAGAAELVGDDGPVPVPYADVRRAVVEVEFRPAATSSAGSSS